MLHGLKAIFSSNKQQSFTSYTPNRLIEFPPVTIIIPFKDKVEVLKACLESIIQKTVYPSYEILLINNQSTEPDTHQYLESIHKIKNIRIVEYNLPFNYSAMHNWVIDRVNTELIVFLNNDTEVINPKWLNSLVACAQSNDVGAVGALLLYPDGSVQHAGTVFVNCKPFHVFYGELPNSTHKKEIFSIQEYSAVTGACLMTKKSLYKKVQGMDDKHLKVGLNDFDLCLRLRTKGYRIIYTPDAKLYHHESYSRESDWTDLAKYKRELKESTFFSKKWKGYKDPFLSIKSHLL